MKKTLAVTAGLAVAAVLIYFLFAPVFRGEIIISPALDLGGFQIRYYGLVLAAAILASYFIARANAWRFGLSKEEVDKVAFWLIVVSFLSARVYFVVSQLSYFQANPSEIFQFWKGGISIFGALLGGLAFVYLYTRKKIYSVWQLLDLIAISLPLGQAIGRFGNFFNYEAYGTPTDLPWKMFVPVENRLQTAEFYHPAFLYEAIASLIIFFVLFSFRGRLKSGNLALIYLIAYSSIRFIIEFIRLDSIYLGEFKLQQMVALLILIVAASALIARNQKAIPKG
jgi:phosphatidylglycerol:prolipoprotein diacylglycerol transferase